MNPTNSGKSQSHCLIMPTTDVLDIFLIFQNQQFLQTIDTLRSVHSLTFLLLKQVKFQ